MTELAVRTTGNFMLLDRTSGREIMPGETTTVPLTPFIEERLATGELVDVDGDYEPVQLPEPEDPIGLPANPDLEPEPEPTTDTDGDGHDDTTGEFVEGNQEAAKPRRGRRGK